MLVCCVCIGEFMCVYICLHINFYIELSYINLLIKIKRFIAVYQYILIHINIFIQNNHTWSDDGWYLYDENKKINDSFVSFPSQVKQTSPVWASGHHAQATDKIGFPIPSYLFIIFQIISFGKTRLNPFSIVIDPTYQYIFEFDLFLRKISMDVCELWKNSI